MEGYSGTLKCPHTSNCKEGVVQGGKIATACEGKKVKQDEFLNKEFDIALMSLHIVSIIRNDF